jgi:molybdopterin/thiamine biosynthesis adenylyltransferase/rhodanese-related sulfurtransferase
MKDNNTNSLNKDEYIRFGRQIMLPEIGVEGQTKIKNAKILLIGAGGLGSPLALYLIAAGVGEIGLVDHDEVDLSNLQRQILYTSEDIGLPKVQCAKKRLEVLYPEAKINTYQTRLTEQNALDIIRDYDLVIDGTDNFETRFLVNDACVFLKKPNIYASIFRFEGQATVFGMGEGPCYRCLYPEPPPAGLVPSCSEAGVLGILPGIMACVQATEAIKLLTQAGDSLSGRLLTYDALTMRFQELSLEKNPDCAICGTNPSITELKSISYACSITPKDMEHRDHVPEISVEKLAEVMESGNYLLVDVREAFEREIFNIDGSLHLPSFKSLKEAIDQLDREQNIVVYCKYGVLSKRAAQILIDNNFQSVFSLKGGIAAWIQQAEPELTEY